MWWLVMGLASTIAAVTGLVGWVAYPQRIERVRPITEQLVFGR